MKIINDKNKTLIRSQMRLLKKNMPAVLIQENSRIICRKLSCISEFKEKKQLFVYVNYNQEVITEELIKEELADMRHNVFVPKVAGIRKMDFYRINDFDKDLAYGAYGILEPVLDNTDNAACKAADYRSVDDEDSVIILPGLAFDMECNRIGYGGGYYDTFLEKHQKMFKIAVCHDFQIITDGALPTEPSDVKMDMIISEKRVILSGK